MSKSVKYFVYGGQSSFVEFDLDYSAAGVTLRGSEVLYTGGSGVETVYAAKGISFDFTNASGKVDRLYLGASIADYSFLKQGTNLLLTEKASGSVLKVLAGSTLSFDQVVFTDGMASSKALYDAAGSGVTPGLDVLVKTPANKGDLYAALGTLPEASVKAFAATNDGVTFGTVPKGGATLIATGGSGVDIVYVAAWSNVDAVDLSGGTDRIYLSGRFSEYARSFQGTTLVLSRSEGVNTETVKVNGGSSFAFDRIIFADGAARSWDLFNALKNNAALPALDTSLTTPGLAPALKPSALANILDLDVRSNIVFQFTEDVIPQAGKLVRIINDSNSATKSGLYGESVVNSFLLDATDPRVQVSGGRITINPDRDLDFSNNYHVEIEAGAFVGKITGKPNPAIIDPSALKFSTVTPSADKSLATSDGLSRMLQSDGSLNDSLVWKDIEGWPNGKTGGQAVLDLSAKNIALVTADLMPAASVLDLSGSGNSLTNIETGDFNLKLLNFGAGDLIYMDDVGRNNENPADALQLIFGPQFSSDIVDQVAISRFNFDASSGKAGGVIEIAGQAFSTPAEWENLIGASQSPFVYGSVVASSTPSDTTPPTLQSATVSTDGRTVSLVFSETLDTASFTPAQVLGRFALSVGTASGWPIESVSISGSQVVITVPMSLPIPSVASLGQGSVGVSYTDLSTANDASNVLQDPAGNDVGNINGYTVQNFSTHVPQPPATTTIQALSAPNTVTEGSSMSFLVSLTAPAPTGGYTVDWRVVLPTTGNPAQAADFGLTSPSAVFPSGSVVVPAGQSSVQFQVPVYGDVLVEADEVFALQVGRAGATPSDPFNSMFQHTAVIVAGDQLPGADTTAPTLTISSAATKILAGSPVNVNFQFSELVNGFDLSDVVVSNGFLSNFYKGSDVYYSAQFQPATGIDGTATFSVAAGRFADVAGNANTAPASLSIPLATVQPVNSGASNFTVPTAGTTGTSDILVRFSEPIFESVAGAAISGISLARNPTQTNGFQGSGTSPQVMGFTLTEGSAAGGFFLLTIRTDSVLAQGDVVCVRIDASSNSFKDADGNRLAGQEVYIGGADANTIDLDGYYPWSPSRQILRGNDGNDTLVGTGQPDGLVDGSGADLLKPVRGGDLIGLVENGSTGVNPIPFSRDTVLIGVGDSRRGFGNTDLITFDPGNSNTGFDWSSSNAAQHDVLALESRVIGGASSFAIAPMAQGGITGHTIAGGIVTFLDSSGGILAVTQATNLDHALEYLRANLRAVGHTVAFRADFDNNGADESLVVYQDTGSLPIAGNAEMPDVVVRIELPAATAAARLASVTLGNGSGANVLEIQDGFDPNPLAVGLTANGVVLNFVEPMNAPASVSALAMSIQVNGAGTVYTPTSVSGVGTAVIGVQAAGLTLGATDWALVTYFGSDAANALSDSSGRLLLARDDSGKASSHSFVLGGSGNNSIDLSLFAAGAGGLEVQAAAGDDSVKGGGSADWISGGPGSDSLRGGAGSDGFLFEQGDSPVLTINTSSVSDAGTMTGAVYTFAGGKAEVIEDFQFGDQIWLNPPFDGITGAAWLNAMMTQPPGTGTAAGMVGDQRFLAMRGALGGNGMFTVGTNAASPDTLVIYDGDGSSGVSQTGFVLRNVLLDDLEGFNGGSSIRLRDTTINGTSGNDFLTGTARLEVINGLAGNDRLEGSGGNDTLDGGNGVDSAAFSGTYAQYAVLIDAAGIKITDKVANRDGVDFLVSVERFLFADGEYKVDAQGTALASLSAQAATVMNELQGAGYTDSVDAAQLTEAQMLARIDDWIDGSPPLLVSQVATRSLASIVGSGDDNELKYGLEFVTGAAGGAGATTLFMRYDLNPLLGQVQPSTLIEFTFPGDVRAILVPESLTYSG